MIHRVMLPGVILFAVLAARHLGAAELEPRAYMNTPVGLNFFIAAYNYSEGGLPTDAASPIQDAQLQIHTEILAYARTLNVRGNAGKFDVILPYSQLSGTALVSGQQRQREVSGFGDPRFRFSYILFGAPALSPQEFAAYQPDLLIGASVQVSVPAGQYDSDKLVNLGAHRWFIKPDIGISKTLGSLTLELSAGMTYYTQNDEYFGGKTLEQDPVYSTQAHLSYTFGQGIWGALDATYDWGGRTTIAGIPGNEVLGNSRLGATLALPVNRKSSIKLYTSTGVSTRAGSDFTLGGIAWQYHW